MNIDAKNVDYKDLNDSIREAKDTCKISNCIGQRFIAAGMADLKITIDGVPGNALGAYLNGAEIEVMGNAQDAVGDTMNDGRIVVHGNIGDAAGYAMRGGKRFVKGSAGYRAGIHMKAYKEKKPVMVIGGKCGSFLGEFQAGGTIVVLGLEENDKHIVGNFPSTGMHGGKIFLRSDCEGITFPGQVHARTATAEDLKEIEDDVKEFCMHFGFDAQEILNDRFTVVVPDTKNPYKQMYVAN